MSRLTAKTLRKAHALARNIHKLGGSLPQGVEILERDYNAWRARVRRGTQRDTLLSAPWSDASPQRAREAAVAACQAALDASWAALEANGWRIPR